MLNLFKLFTRSEQRVVLFLIASALIASTILIITHIQREKALSKIELVHSAFEIFEQEITSEKGEEEITHKRVNINSASLQELELLPNIGSVGANRIIEYRKTHGKFKAIEEITKVKGIGKKTFEKIRKLITVENDIEGKGKITHEKTEKKVRHKKIKEKITPKKVEEKVILQQVNINSASLQELELLPNIGPVIANRIIEYRETQGKFKAIEEITKVKGIGKKTFEKIKKMITVENDDTDNR